MPLRKAELSTIYQQKDYLRYASVFPNKGLFHNKNYGTASLCLVFLFVTPLRGVKLPTIYQQRDYLRYAAVFPNKGIFHKKNHAFVALLLVFLFVTPLRKAELSTSLIQIKKPPTSVGGFPCREEGIRTLDTLPYTHFPGVRLRPLGHLSLFILPFRHKSAFRKLI